MAATAIRRGILLGTLLLVAFACAACGSGEPEQRKSFIEFLQQRVIGRTGLHVPRISDDQRKAFGPYADHYAVITEFHDGMDKSVSAPMKDVLRAGNVRSVQEVVDRRKDFAVVREGIARMLAALDQMLAKADTAKSRLEQPEDLKAVYAKAYEKTVATPAREVRSVLPVADEGLLAIQRLADLLDQNRSGLKLTGNMIEVSDAGLKARIGAAMADMNAKGRRLNEAKRRLQSVISGAQ